MIPEPKPTPKGAKCTAHVGLFDPDSPVCGKPAVISWWLEDDDPPSEDPTHEDWCHNCDEHRIRRLRIEAKHDQSAAFEEEHGYPPNLDIVNLAYRLGLSRGRFVSFLDHTAPTVIMRHAHAVYWKRRNHVRKWLKDHTPQNFTAHVPAINALLDALEKGELLYVEDKWNEESVEALRQGLLEARMISAEVDIANLEL